jgi:hypothetical protein
MLDDLTSGFNIAKNITLERAYNQSLGFTHAEVEEMLDYYNILPEEKKQKTLEDMKKYYNGYLFHPEAKERLYNPDMVLHFLYQKTGFTQKKTYQKNKLQKTRKESHESNKS